MAKGAGVAAPPESGGTMKSEGEVLMALATRFCAPEYAFMSHVRNGTGYTRRVVRTADALAFSLWPSRGLELHGFEVKVARSDWVREMKEPDKAEAIMSFCERWWVVVGDAEMVRPGELPPTWGLLVPRGKKLVVKVEAPKREAKPLDRLMLAAILRRATEDVVLKSTVEMMIHERVNKEVDRRMAEYSDGARLQKRIDDLEASIARFEERSGINVRSFDAGEIAAAARLVMTSGRAVERARSALEHPVNTLEFALKQLHEARRQMDEAGAAPATAPSVAP